MDWSWTSGLIGGLVAAVLIYCARVPQALDEHDLRLDEIDTDLRRWTRDEERGLSAELYAIGNDANAKHALGAGGQVAAEIGARERYGQASRDPLSDAVRSRKRIVVAERLPHQILRRLKVRPLPELEAAPALREAIERWGTEAATVAEPTTDATDPSTP